MGDTKVNTLVTRQNNKLVIQGGGINVSVTAVDEAGNQVALDEDGNLRVKNSDKIVVDATGFESNQEVEAWLFSNPVLLGTMTSSSNGSVSGTYAVPNNLENGDHRLVLKSQTAEGSDTLISIGIIAGSPSDASFNVSLAVGIVLGLAILTGLLLPVALRRRRESQ